MSLCATYRRGLEPRPTVTTIAGTESVGPAVALLAIGALVAGWVILSPKKTGWTR